MPLPLPLAVYLSYLDLFDERDPSFVTWIDLQRPFNKNSLKATI
jgi:hypothetical protein